MILCQRQIETEEGEEGTERRWLKENDEDSINADDWKWSE